MKLRQANKKIENPADKSIHSNHDRLTYVTYKQFLRSFPEKNINLEKVNTNVDSLLALANLERMPEIVEVEFQNVENEVDEFFNDETSKKNHVAIEEKFIYGGLNYSFLLTIGIAMLLVALLLLYINKRKG